MERPGETRETGDIRETEKNLTSQPPALQIRFHLKVKIKDQRGKKLNFERSKHKLVQKLARELIILF